MRMNRKIPRLTAKDAASHVSNGDRLAVGGFGMTGYPIHLINALSETEIKDLTYIGNNVGEPGLGGGRLIRNQQIRHVIGSYFTSNPEVVNAHINGLVSCDLLPQGTLAEALRAAGAGLGGFYTPTAANTQLTSDREHRRINGVDMVLVEPLRADVAFVRAWRADTSGNLQYRMTENNFNHCVAMAADLVIAEVDEIVAVGEIDPHQVHTPGCYIDFLVQGSIDESHLGTSASIKGGAKKIDDVRLAIASRALAELSDGDIVNLGVGMPTLVADLLTDDHAIVLHSENGMLGVGPAPLEGGAMDYPINASKIPVTALPGASYFDSAESFAMIRGGHVDVAMMGALQVSQSGDLANWAVPGQPVLGVGGAMDLAVGASRLIVMMTHCDRSGVSKVVKDCTLPVTGKGVVDVLITDLAVFSFSSGAMYLTELMPGVSVAEVEALTDAEFECVV